MSLASILGENAKSWYFGKEQLRKTPSLVDGIGWKEETRLRYEGCTIIKNLGVKMNLHYNTVATGTVFFHRFYMLHSFKHFAVCPSAVCCLFLAGKVEENPKKNRDLIRIAQTECSAQQFGSFDDDPHQHLVDLERILLPAIQFDFNVDHPYKWIVPFSKCFKLAAQEVKTIIQMAWTFINDSLLTTLCLEWQPEIVTIAMIFLAFKMRKLPPVTDWMGKHHRHRHWWDLYVRDLRVETIEDICHQVLELYTPKSETETNGDATSSCKKPASPSPSQTSVNMNICDSPSSCAHHSPPLPARTSKSKTIVPPAPTLPQLFDYGSGFGVSLPPAPIAGFAPQCHPSSYYNASLFFPYPTTLTASSSGIACMLPMFGQTCLPTMLTSPPPPPPPPPGQH